MKVLVISDIHGSSYYAKKIKEINKKEEPDKIIVLGDLYYHGPRNELTQEYKPMEVAKILNSLKEKLIVIKGNCDSEVDQTISEFDFKENVEININGYNVFLTHGHKYNMDRLPPLGIKMDIMMYGHFHEGFIIEENGITQKSSDDGEPSGTAGEPILNIIKSNNLQNVVIIVTRYFGGILLGTGGLTRAYSEAAGKVVEQSELIQKEPGMEVELEIDYNDNEKFKYYCQKNNVNIIKIEYTENILYKIELNEKEYKKIEERNKTNNKQLDINIKNIKLKCRKYVKKVG